MNPGLAEGQVMLLRKVSGCCQVALAQQRQHLRGSYLRHTRHKVLLAHGLSGLCEQSDRAIHISLGQFQAGEKHLTEHEAVKHAIKLPRQVQALSPMLLSSIQVVPLVEDTSQAK